MIYRPQKAEVSAIRKLNLIEHAGLLPVGVPAPIILSPLIMLFPELC